MWAACRNISAGPVTYLNDMEVTMKTSRKLLLGAATLAVVAVAGCASDPYYDHYAYHDRYAYVSPGYTYYTPAPRYYSYGYYYGPRYYSDGFWRSQPQPG